MSEETMPQPDVETVEEETAPTRDERDTATEENHASTELNKARSDAAKYRTTLRDVRTERDALAERVTALQTQMTEQHLAAHLEKPAAFWLTGAKPEQFFGDDGQLNAEALSEAARTAITDHGLAAKPIHGFESPSMRERPNAPAPTWQDMLNK